MRPIAEIPGLACPGGGGELVAVDDALASGSGDARFPVVDGMPLLVMRPEDYVLGERSLLEQLAESHREGAVGYATLADRGGIRAEALRGISAGLGANAEVLAGFAALLPPSESAIESYQAPLGTDLFACLARDWGGAPEAEAELAITRDAILGALAGVPSDRALVLGAGTGRLLCDLDAALGNAVGIDLSFANAAIFARLCATGRAEACQLLSGNFLRSGEECQWIDARRSRAGGRPGFVVGDACHLPFVADLFDVTVSPYFTDLVPLSRLLPEVRRVLRPGGHFVHFGPLGYAFPGEQEYYAIDELPQAFAAHGFEITAQSFVTNSYFANARRLNRLAFDNLLLVARLEVGR